jgi:hypothetical protein
MARKFGVEIEAVNCDRRIIGAALNHAGISATVEGYNHQTRNHWKVVTDASVANGFEVVSPILEGDVGLDDLVAVAKVIEQCGATVNKSCGLHVHVDARDMTLPQMKRICKMWVKYEGCFDSIQPASRRNNHYCDGIAKKFVSFEQAFKSIEKCETVRELRQVMNSDGRFGNGYTSRYHKLNLESLVRHGTIEFRQHAGTVDATKIANWVKLVTSFVECAVSAKSIKITGTGNLESFLKVVTEPAVKKFYRERAKKFEGVVA